MTAALEISDYKSKRRLQTNSLSVQKGLYVIAIALVALNIIFWAIIFSILACWFYKARKRSVFYTFKDGLVRKRCVVLWYYIQNILLRIAIAVMIGYTSFLTKEQNQTLWMYICLLNLANIFPLKVFKNFSENFNSVVANALLFWISFVFMIMQT